MNSGNAPKSSKFAKIENSGRVLKGPDQFIPETEFFSSQKNSGFKWTVLSEFLELCAQIFRDYWSGSNSFISGEFWFFSYYNCLQVVGYSG